jgi:hypothetical protein
MMTVDGVPTAPWAPPNFAPELAAVILRRDERTTVAPKMGGKEIKPWPSSW